MRVDTTYEDWLAAVEIVWETHGAIGARCWNLARETRIPEALAEFRAILAARFGGELTASPDLPGAAACAALELAIGQIMDGSHGLLGLIPLQRPADVPRMMVTHIDGDDIMRYYSRQNPKDDHPIVVLDRPLKVRDDGSEVSPFIWFTFEADGAAFTDDPTEMKRRLGLDRVEEGTTLYRLEFEVDPERLRVPSCLDAELRAAWAPPPNGRDWGMTRDLETGQPAFPELLGWTEDHRAARPVARLVSPPGQTARIGPVAVDYMAERAP